MVRLIALKPHTPDGITRYKKGDPYSISEKSSKILIATGMARLDTTEEPKAKRTYQRRDMRAED